MADNEPQQVSAPAPGAPEGAADGGSERPRLQLKPRSANAGAPAAIAKSNKSNPFGAARPREEILKSKGIDVAKVEKELDERTRRLPRMNKQQQEEYDAAEAEIAFAKSELEKAESDEAKAAAEEELKQKQNSVNELIESFRAVEIKPRRAAAADSSETGAPEANSRPTFIRPSERRARREERNMQQGFDSYNNNSQGGQSGDFSSFGRRGFGGDRTCYNCGQAGHISRDCPDGNSGGGGGGGGFSGGRGFGGEGGGGGGRTCYNCGQPGHISRDCPDGNSGGGGYSGGGNSGGFGGGFGGAFGGGNSRGGFGGGDRTCYNCGQPGHISRDCPDRQGGYGGSSDNYGGGGF